uniref:Uncharacterized protein n=1 Tax=Romanomermis culicivorax TaxID=13658 RepID=A0A915KGE6_ROMCU
NVQIHQQHQQQIWPTESEQETSFLFNGAGNFGPSSHNGIMTRSFSNNSASHSLASSSGFESLKALIFLELDIVIGIGIVL